MYCLQCEYSYQLCAGGKAHIQDVLHVRTDVSVSMSRFDALASDVRPHRALTGCNLLHALHASHASWSSKARSQAFVEKCLSLSGVQVLWVREAHIQDVLYMGTDVSVTMSRVGA